MKENKQFNQIIDSLVSEGVEVDKTLLKQYQEDTLVRSVFIKVVSILGGLLGVGLFLGFLFLTLNTIINLGIIFIVLGLISFTISFVINKSKDSAIKDGLAVALFIAGFLLVIFGIAELQGTSWNISSSASIAFVLSVICFFVYKNQIITFLSTFNALIAVHCLIVNNHTFSVFYIFFFLLILLTVFLFWKETALRLSRYFTVYYVPFFFAVFLYSLVLSIIASTNMFMGLYYAPSAATLYISVFGTIAVNLFTIHLIFKKLNITNIIVMISIYVLAAVFMYFLGFIYPAFMVGLLFLLWSFYNQYKIGFVLSICTFIWAIGMFYYDLKINLLEKSISLMVTGVLFLGAYWLMCKNWKEDEKE